jgi:hypothetical protein
MVKMAMRKAFLLMLVVAVFSATTSDAVSLRHRTTARLNMALAKAKSLAAAHNIPVLDQTPPHPKEEPVPPSNTTVYVQSSGRHDELVARISEILDKLEHKLLQMDRESKASLDKTLAEAQEELEAIEGNATRRKDAASEHYTNQARSIGHRRDVETHRCHNEFNRDIARLDNGVASLQTTRSNEIQECDKNREDTFTAIVAKKSGLDKEARHWNRVADTDKKTAEEATNAHKDAQYRYEQAKADKPRKVGIIKDDQDFCRKRAQRNHDDAVEKLTQELESTKTELDNELNMVHSIRALMAQLNADRLQGTMHQPALSLLEIGEKTKILAKRVGMQDVDMQLDADESEKKGKHHEEAVQIESLLRQVEERIKEHLKVAQRKYDDAQFEHSTALSKAHQQCDETARIQEEEVANQLENALNEALTKRGDMNAANAAHAVTYKAFEEAKADFDTFVKAEPQQREDAHNAHSECFRMVDQRYNDAVHALTGAGTALHSGETTINHNHTVREPHVAFRRRLLSNDDSSNEEEDFKPVEKVEGSSPMVDAKEDLAANDGESEPRSVSTPSADVAIATYRQSINQQLKGCTEQAAEVYDMEMSLNDQTYSAAHADIKYETKEAHKAFNMSVASNKERFGNHSQNIQNERQIINAIREMLKDLTKVADCKWSEWGPWTKCSSACGGGKRSRGRFVSQDAVGGGKPCKGSNMEVETCNEKIVCNKDCKWDKWNAWSGCSATCGNGIQTRSREHLRKQSGNGSRCIGNYTEHKRCYIRPCPIDCNMAPVSNWSTCTAGCGQGHQLKTTLPVVTDAFGGKKCPDASTWRKTKKCKLTECPEDCKVSVWSGWSACSRVCGVGEQTRTRTVVESTVRDGKTCNPELVQSQTCMVKKCPVDCKLSDWSTCSSSCGNGTTSRWIEIAAQNGGIPCSTDVERPCFLKTCSQEAAEEKQAAIEADKRHEAEAKPPPAAANNVTMTPPATRSNATMAPAAPASNATVTVTNATSIVHVLGNATMKNSSMLASHP